MEETMDNEIHPSSPEFNRLLSDMRKMGDSLVGAVRPVGGADPSSLPEYRRIH